MSESAVMDALVTGKVEQNDQKNDAPSLRPRRSSIIVPKFDTAIDNGQSDAAADVHERPLMTTTRSNADHVHSEKPTVSFAAPNTAVESHQRQHGEADDDNDDGGGFKLDTEVKKKKKRKTRSKMKRGLNQPCGFEEYYVDPPVTPQEFSQEEVLYAPSKPFSERIQTAIQRYTARRKFDELRANLWVKYLRFGGIESGAKMFGGNALDGAINDGDDLTKEDIITLKAREYVSEAIVTDESAAAAAADQDDDDDDYDPAFMVDFAAVAAGFFSLHIRGSLDMSDQATLRVYTGVVRNWLNYLLHHNVCNEHRENILEARKVVDMAESQLWALRELSGVMPGSFSKACAAIYVQAAAAAEYADKADVKTLDWDWDKAWVASDGDMMEKEVAHKVFLAALASRGTDELCDAYTVQNDEGTTRAGEPFETGLEVVAIEKASPQIRAMYEHPTNHGLVPMGVMRAKTWIQDWGAEEDFTESEEDDERLPGDKELRTKEKSIRDYEFWIDDETLAKMFVGLKLVADVCELSFGGLLFLDKVKTMFPSFVLWLPNELMEDWREHVWIPPKKQAIHGDYPDECDGMGDADANED